MPWLPPSRTFGAGWRGLTKFPAALFDPVTTLERSRRPPHARPPHRTRGPCGRLRQVDLHRHLKGACGRIPSRPGRTRAHCRKPLENEHLRHLSKMPSPPENQGPHLRRAGHRAAGSHLLPANEGLEADCKYCRKICSVAPACACREPEESRLVYASGFTDDAADAARYEPPIRACIDLPTRGPGCRRVRGREPSG